MDVADTTTETTETMLDDPGDLTEQEAILTAPREWTEHVAKCTACEAGARFRLSPTRGAIEVLDRYGVDPEYVFGIGESGFPICPNGHGEMSLADETLKPAEEAFSEAIEQSREPVQRSLPGVVPAFNFENAYLELEGKAAEVQALHDDYQHAAEEARDAKKAWDKAAELYTNMALEFRRRRQSRDEEQTAAETRAEEAQPRLVKCTWEQAHTDEPCPLCTGSYAAIVLTRILGTEIPPADAQGHVDAVAQFLVGLEVEEAEDQLQRAGLIVRTEVIRSWTPEERKAVVEWADILERRATGDTDQEIPEKPAVIGKQHIASKIVGGESQTCTQCDRVLVEADGSESANYYTEGQLVGTDCTGKPAADHHYPAKKARRKAQA